MNARPAGAVGWLSPRQRRQLADAVRALLESCPEMTRTEIQRRTGAPENLVRAVKDMWTRRRAA